MVDSQIVITAVVNDGIEEWISGGGMLGVSSDQNDDPNRKLSWNVTFPQSLQKIDEMVVKVNKISIEQIKDALKAMAKLPMGCFEQTASMVAP